MNRFASVRAPCFEVPTIQRERGLRVKSIGFGEKADDLQPFDSRQFAEALFSEKE